MVVWLRLRKKDIFQRYVLKYLWIKCYDICDLLQMNSKEARWLGLWVWQDLPTFDS